MYRPGDLHITLAVYAVSGHLGVVRPSVGNEQGTDIDAAGYIQSCSDAVIADIPPDVGGVAYLIAIVVPAVDEAEGNLSVVELQSPPVVEANVVEVGILRWTACKSKLLRCKRCS